MDIEAIAAQINTRATGRPIGDLQALQDKLKSHKRRSPPQIFSKRITIEGFAFHSGGRSELQFNLGLDQVEGDSVVRYGVAFSFQQTL